MRRIAVIGSGYVGLVAGTCLADFGLNIIVVDNDEDKINKLKEGIIPIYEPGLDDLVHRNVYYKRLNFTTDIKYAVENCDVIFIAVGTPPKDDGRADLQYVLQVAEDIGKYMNGYKIVVDKSTVPIGTGQKVRKVLQEQLQNRGVEYIFDVVSNPEFLREGTAIHDFTHPDRVVIGSESDKARGIMRDVYRVLYINETPFVETNIETAEMIKYAANAFLATKITFINEVANLCEKVGANVQHVAKAMGKDGRISPKFLHAGPGYGGSCFPKDTKAIVNIGEEYGVRMSVVEQVIKANENQKLRMVEKIEGQFEDLKDKTICILGITFKPQTDDMREAPSLVICRELVKRGAKLKIFDPEGQKEGEWRFNDILDRITFCRDEYEAVVGADALVLLTEWHQFRNMDLEVIHNSMSGKLFFDFRNIYSREIVEEKGFKYFAVGR
ncbi:UDP-glucose dehydrogenase family protein [Clostridium saccharoperbutylacetonicum]